MTVDAPAERVWSNFCCFWSSHQMRCVRSDAVHQEELQRARGVAHCSVARRTGGERIVAAVQGARDTIPDRLRAKNNNYDVLCARTQKKHEALYILCLERCRLPVSDCHEHGQDAAHQNVIAVETSHPTRDNK